MVKAVFTGPPDPRQGDDPSRRCHFRQDCLEQAERALGDWILYFDPHAARCFAVARLERIGPDPRNPGHYCGYVGNFLFLDRPVPFQMEGAMARNLDDGAFDAVLRAGFIASEVDFIPDSGGGIRLDGRPGLAEEQATFRRPMVEKLVRQPFRDAAFARQVKSAYANRCAVTGLKIINGGGRPEVQAAHIRPVADDGTDSVRNGIALSATVHWMFDRGLISLADDFTILTAPGKVPADIRRLFRPDNRLILPEAPELRPHPMFLDYHRTRVFKG